MTSTTDELLAVLAECVARDETEGRVSNTTEKARAILARETGAYTFSEGDRVRHTLIDDGDGVVDAISPAGLVTVLFDKPTPSGRPFRGNYDVNWFRLHPMALIKVTA